MHPADLAAFARRDWKMVEDSKTTYWKTLADSGDRERLIHAADALRRFAQECHPGWPSEEERTQDLESHARVASALSHAARLWNR